MAQAAEHFTEAISVAGDAYNMVPFVNLAGLYDSLTQSNHIDDNAHGQYYNKWLKTLCEAQLALQTVISSGRLAGATVVGIQNDLDISWRHALQDKDRMAGYLRLFKKHLGLDTRTPSHLNEETASYAYVYVGTVLHLVAPHGVTYEQHLSNLWLEDPSNARQALNTSSSGMLSKLSDRLQLLPVIKRAVDYEVTRPQGVACNDNVMLMWLSLMKFDSDSSLPHICQIVTNWRIRNTSSVFALFWHMVTSACTVLQDILITDVSAAQIMKDNTTYKIAKRDLEELLKNKTNTSRRSVSYMQFYHHQERGLPLRCSVQYLSSCFCTGWRFCVDDSGLYHFRNNKCAEFVIPMSMSEVTNWTTQTGHTELVDYANQDQNLRSAIKFQIVFNYMGPLAVSCATSSYAAADITFDEAMPVHD